MNKEPLISIIVPAYNVEDYLGECLDSILKYQDFRDFEVLLIDDGSSDSTPQLCDEYARMFSCVFVFHKKNGGASSARNEGLRLATGKYVLFVDADDYIDKCSIGKIAALLENEGDVDLLMLNSAKVFADGSIKQHNKFSKMQYYKQNHNDILKSMVDYLPDCVWGKLIRREILIENNIRFIEGIICEDVDFSILVLMHAKTYNAAEFDYYFYRSGREGSVMNQGSNRTFSDLLYIVEKWNELSESVYKEHMGVLRGWNHINYCWFLLTRYRALDKQDKKIYKPNMNRMKHILRYSKDIGSMLVWISYNIFGLTFASWTAAIYSVLFKGLNRRNR